MKDLAAALDLIEEVLGFSEYCPIYQAFESLERVREILVEATKEDSP